MNEASERFPWIAVATAALFAALAFVIPSGRQEVANGTIEINTKVFLIAAIALFGLALVARVSTKPIWSALAVKGSIGVLVLTALHFVVVGIVWRTMGG